MWPLLHVFVDNRYPVTDVTDVFILSASVTDVTIVIIVTDHVTECCPCLFCAIVTDGVLDNVQLRFCCFCVSFLVW